MNELNPAGQSYGGPVVSINCPSAPIAVPGSISVTLRVGDKPIAMMAYQIDAGANRPLAPPATSPGTSGTCNVNLTTTDCPLTAPHWYTLTVYAWDTSGRLGENACSFQRMR
jgi:hypothetical protein